MPYTLLDEPAPVTPKGKYMLLDEPPQPERSLSDSLGRQVGLTVRAGIKGVTALPEMAGNALGLRSSDAVDALLRVLPHPENPVERFSGDVAGAMGGQGAIAKAAGLVSGAGPMVSRLMALLRTDPGLQVTSAGMGTGVSSAAREGEVGPMGQTVAGVAGTLLPSAAKATGSAALRGVLRGGEEGRQTVAENLRSFGEAGTTPTVGQATESRAARLAETMLSKTPGSAGVMAAKAEAQHKELGAKVGELASDLSTRTGAEAAGRAITAGIKGDNGFLDYFRAKQAELYGKVDALIPPDSPVALDSTNATLGKLTTPIKGATATSEKLVNPKLVDIRDALTADAGQNGTLPYQALKELRSRIGSMLNSSELVSNMPRAELKQLYGALSNDLTAAAAKAGADALSAAERANTFTRAGHARIEQLQPIVGKTDPEDIFKAAVSGTKEGSTTIWGVMRSLPPEGQKTVAATVLRRLGVATPGNQNELGELFSPETFLTSWNKITPESKMALFSRFGPDYVKSLDSIASTAANLREGSKIFANPSGTEGAFTARMGVAGVLLSALWGHPGIAAGLATGMTAANIGAHKLITNPAFVRWLAKSTAVSPAALTSQLSSLSNIANQQPAIDREAIRDYIDAVRAKTGG